MRVVSLVPSATETLRALGVDPVACTRFCEQPDLPTIGGTKNPDVGAIVALRPDIVVVNDEENRLEDSNALFAAGVRVHSMSPRSVADVGPAIGDLCAAIGIETPARFSESAWGEWLVASRAGSDAPTRAAAVLVWRRPWMTLAADTYGSSVLEQLGVRNVYADGEHRYPEVTLEDLAARHPDLLVLPDEPYPFRARHIGELEGALAPAHAVLVDGQDLFWWGARTPDAVTRLRASLG